MTPSGSNGASAGRPRQVTDEQAFQALAEAITEVGPTRWTLDDVGKRLGLTGPALGYRFGSKRGLLVAFAAHQPDATAERFDQAAAANPPLEAVYQVLTSDLGHMDTRAKVANNVAMLSIDLADDELAKHAKAQARVIKAKLAQLVADAELVTPDQADELAEQIYTVWSGAIITWAIDGDGPLEGWLRDHIDAVVERPTR